jgi:hypothetical protein
MLGGQRSKDRPTIGRPSTRFLQARRIEWNSSPNQVRYGHNPSGKASRVQPDERQADECDQGGNATDNPMSRKQGDEGCNDSAYQQVAPCHSG